MSSRSLFPFYDGGCFPLPRKRTIAGWYFHLETIKQGLEPPKAMSFATKMVTNWTAQATNHWRCELFLDLDFQEILLKSFWKSPMSKIRLYQVISLYFLTNWDMIFIFPSGMPMKKSWPNWAGGPVAAVAVPPRLWCAQRVDGRARSGTEARIGRDPITDELFDGWGFGYGHLSN